MKKVIILNENYIDEMLIIQKKMFSENPKELISKKTFLEFLKKEQICGYIGATNKLLGFLFIKIYDDKLRIYQIVTLGGNLGIGTKLINFVFDFQKREEYKLIYLEVNINNYKAINFYFKHGFRIKNIIKNFYNNGDNAFNMELKC